MSLTKDDFTSNEFLSPPYLNLEDETIEIVGYIMKTSNNSSSTQGKQYHKVVVSNGVGKEIQVIAWEKLTNKISALQMGQICLIGPLKAIKANPRYNSGNVDFQLLIKENTIVQTFGYHHNEGSNADELEEVSIPEAYSLLDKIIKVQGIIRTLPREHKNRGYDCVIGAITDCDYKLEFKLSFGKLTLPLKMGQSVIMKGTMAKVTHGPPNLMIREEMDIEILETPIVSFVDIMKGFRSKK
ncbi:hypothetical protein TKK_0010216 [Trichogramma kaykai]|uniref:OB domain-containing protein n=1 Tax=Trichogramma kaykai TaxID=54128 RepID=A0ABD2WYX7_9HYME